MPVIVMCMPVPAQNATMEFQLRYAMACNTDVLVTSLRTADLDFVLRFLRANQACSYGPYSPSPYIVLAHI